ncbi:MAG: UrcA family protein [Erythrobacter sp.]
MHDPRQSLATARIIMIAAPCVLLVGALTSPVNAEPDHRQAHVEYADLDLSSDAGRAALDKRLNRAIRDVCRAPFTRSVRAASQARACAEKVRETVLVQRNAILARASRSDGAHMRDTATARDTGPK